MRRRDPTASRRRSAIGVLGAISATLCVYTSASAAPVHNESRVAVESVSIGTPNGAHSDTSADSPPGERFGERSPVRAATVSLQRYVALFHDADALDAALAQLNAAPDNVWQTGLYGFSAEMSDAQLASVRSAPGLLSVDADEPVAMSAAQTNAPWGLDRIDQRNRPLDNTYTYTSTGAGVDAYVIDSGVHASHEQFTGRIPYGAYWDFGDGYEYWDCNGHGTHVAGTIGGTTYGVAKEVTIIPIRVLDCDGAS